MLQNSLWALQDFMGNIDFFQKFTRFTSGTLGNNLFTNFVDAREEPMVLQFLNYSPPVHTSCLIEDKVKVLIAQSCLILRDPIDCSLPSYSFHGILHARILPGCHFLFQGIFPTQGSNLGLLSCRQILYHLSHHGSQGQA